ncbi:24411_t:CDS:2, partial [Racocetra persica]
QLGIDKLNIISLMKNVYFCAKNHQSINLFSNLCELVTTQIHNHKEYITSDRVCVFKTPQYEKNKTKASYGSYTNNNSENRFLASICDIIEEGLFEELNASKYWSLMIDESNTISDDKHLAIVAKYLINNIPYMRYFGMLNLEETNALYIFTQLKSFFKSKNFNFNSLIYFGSDGASTMLEHQSGVSARLKNLNPFISSNYCIAHRLHLAGKDASLKVEYFKEYEKILHKIYSYFSRSYKRQKMLHLMQDINDKPNLELQNHIETRWLLLSNVVGNLYQIIDSILSTLNEDSLEREKEAKNLILLLDEDFVIVTIFLADLTTILKRLINVFQSNYVALSHLKPHLKTAISSISESFIGSTDIQPTYGIILHNYIDRNSINQETLPVFIEDYAKAIIEAL